MLTIEIVPALLAIRPSPFLQVIGPGAVPRVNDGLASLLTVWLAFFGFVGVVMLYSVIFFPNTVIRADTAGLHSRPTRRNSSFLPWASIEEIAARMRHGTVNDYVVRGDAGRVVINWSARRSLVVDETPSDGALPISPDELAALVVKRSGKPLRVAHRL
jgi:hypothetical protein